MKLSVVLLVMQASTPQATPDSTPAAPRNPNGRVVPAVVAIATAAAPRLDGRLDDPIWAQSQAVSDFTQVEPVDGAEPAERTEVRVTYDRQALYVGARMYDSDPSGIAGRLGRRDSYTSSDLFTVVIDSYHDHRTAFRFRVNPAGVRSDDITSNDDIHGDDSWDPVWSVATRIDSLGWVAEIRIPFSQLRFAGGDEQVWGINFTRFVFRTNEFTRWSWTPNTEQGFASLFGHLLGVRDVPAPRRLEVLPYTVAKTDHTEGADPDDPFNDGSLQNVSGGVDLKYGVTSELTLDATVNPDFGQVEADPAVVNLSAFETYFSERRPFFVEGANIFQFGAGSGGFVFGAPQLFYSRRVGRSPSRSASEAGSYVENPQATSILGAAKLSGKTRGWSIGFLDAVTAEEVARIERPDGSRVEEPVEPLANYGVVSVRRDLRGGASGVGILATAVNRSLGDQPLYAGLRASAYTGGVDFFHRFASNQFAVSGSVSASRIEGAPSAITAAQRSSARYYQRPDQDHVALDPDATSMTGYSTSIQAGKVSGNWIYGTDFYAYSPGFEVNDAGFETQVDQIFHGIRITRRWLRPGTVFRNFSVDATWSQGWNFGGTRTFRGAYLGADGEFLNYWSFGVGTSYSFPGMSDRATRGGPLMEVPRQWSASAFVASDSRKAVSGVGFGGYSRNRYGGWGVEVAAELELRPTGAFTVTLSPSYMASHSIGFYVTQLADPTATATFGRRYVFSELDQDAFDLTVRMDLALTPDLSIQLWAQPFVAAGDYDGFKELAAPASFDFVRYGQDGGSTLTLDASAGVYVADPDGPGPSEAFAFGNPDFRFRSLRGNLVLRWEYLPGSTLFLVWNHGRSGYASDPTFRVLDEFGNLWGDDQRNTFLVKMNYWLSL